MFRKIYTIQYLVLVLSMSFILGGCALWDGMFSSYEEEVAAPQLMESGEKSFERGNYETAAETFRKLKDRYPYSPLALKAELRLADSLYGNGLYEEAFEAYNDFERMHPKNEEIPYVIFKKGMCHFSRVSTIDRDQSHTMLAKEEFERLVRRFPRSEYADKARIKIRKCYVNMAEYELYVGHYYFKKGQYRAAMRRYSYLIEHYPDMGQYKEALEYYKKAKEMIPREQAHLEKKKTSIWYRLLHPF